MTDRRDNDRTVASAVVLIHLVLSPASWRWHVWVGRLLETNSFGTLWEDTAPIEEDSRHPILQFDHSILRLLLHLLTCCSLPQLVETGKPVREPS